MFQKYALAIDFKISEEMLKIECSCLTNVISLINATDTCENQNKALLHMLYQHLKKRMYSFLFLQETGYFFSNSLTQIDVDQTYHEFSRPLLTNRHNV